MIREYLGHRPQVDKAAFVASSAEVIGQVVLGQDASVWYCATLRGDNAPIIIGDRSNVQDNAVIHVNEGDPVHIGEDVTIGHTAIVHACTIHNRVLIGMGAIILDYSVINDDTIVGAGALVPMNKEYPPGVLLLGSPAKVVRELTDEEIMAIRTNAIHYIDISLKHVKSGN
ncbi:MAG: gamma carbonic anhydrase family protein [Sphaerochaetaceae bacterium]|jgi:carbonic anhydrase/acetyltransferase-like protein (isoleucine patch superfamily)